MADQPQPLPRATRLSDRVAAQIQALVTDRALAPGEKLPSERELCALLGVSRTVVREAVRALVARGLLEVRAGGGTLVRAPDTALVAELMTIVLRAGGDVAFGHVHEVRRLLEVEIAGLAAERRNNDDLRALEAQLQAMAAHEDLPQRWAAADVAFHDALARATHNPLYGVLLSSIVDMLLEVRLTGVGLPDTPQKAYQHHQAIYRCIQAGDRAGARKAMQEHLRESEETFLKAHFSKTQR
jgi:GntR family transcriptional repressor for pyruvate dehydrogenase complex